eukprot:scaffold464431_cov55-Attheya_sp.AAC.1
MEQFQFMSRRYEILAYVVLLTCISYSHAVVPAKQQINPVPTSSQARRAVSIHAPMPPVRNLRRHDSVSGSSFDHHKNGDKYERNEYNPERTGSDMPNLISPPPTGLPASSLVGELTASPTISPVVPTQAPIVPIQAFISPTQAPISPTQALISPTQAPIAPTGAPIAPTEAPIAPTGAPIAPTGAPIAPTEAPVPPTLAPIASSSEPISAPTNDMCLSDNVGSFGNYTISSSFIRPVKFYYEMETLNGTTASDINDNIMPILERGMSDAILPVLFSDVCGPGGRRLQVTEQVTRNLQIIGVSSRPDELILPNVQCSSIVSVGRCDVIEGEFQIIYGGSTATGADDERKVLQVLQDKMNSANSSFADLHDSIMSLAFIGAFNPADQTGPDTSLNAATVEEQPDLTTSGLGTTGIAVLGACAAVALVALVAFRRRHLREDESQADSFDGDMEIGIGARPIHQLDFDSEEEDRPTMSTVSYLKSRPFRTTADSEASFAASTSTSIDEGKQPMTTVGYLQSRPHRATDNSEASYVSGSQGNQSSIMNSSSSYVNTSESSQNDDTTASAEVESLMSPAKAVSPDARLFDESIDGINLLNKTLTPDHYERSKVTSQHNNAVVHERTIETDESFNMNLFGEEPRLTVFNS